MDEEPVVIRVAEIPGFREMGERFKAERNRQEALTLSLGQVTCSKAYRHREYGPCPSCGAAV